MSAITAFKSSRNKLCAAKAPFEIKLNEQDLGYYPNAPANMAELINHGRQHGDKIFLHHLNEAWSFKRFFALVDHISAALQNNYQVQAGQHIALCLRNCPEWMAAFAAIAITGAVAVPVNSWGKREELAHVLQDSGASIVFCDSQRLKLIGTLLPDLACELIVCDNETEHPLPAHCKTLDSVLNNCKATTAAACEPQAHDPAMLMYTSGTSGKAKGVASTQVNICQALANIEMNGSATIRALPEPLRTQAMTAPSAPMLLCVPLFHVSGCYALFLSSLRAGRCLVVMPKWDVEQALTLIQEHRIGTLTAAPAMILALLQSPLFDSYDCSSLRAIAGGGSACPSKMNDLCGEKLGPVSMGTGYGMTESNAVGASFSGALYRYKPSSAGLLAPIVEFKTCDEQGRTLPQGQSGEIYLRSICVANKYHNNPSATEESFVDGWLRTGDVGYIDDEDFVFIVDRAKDIVIRSGENIAAVEVESCILQLDDVSDVAAFSIPSDLHGEELAVAVHCKPDNKLNAESIQTHVKQQLATFKTPAKVYFSPQALPRNAMGKLNKKDIRTRFLGL